jgi:hypothetical protein
MFFTLRKSKENHRKNVNKINVINKIFFNRASVKSLKKSKTIYGGFYPLTRKIFQKKEKLPTLPTCLT